MSLPQHPLAVSFLLIFLVSLALDFFLVICTCFRERALRFGSVRFRFYDAIERLHLQKYKTSVFIRVPAPNILLNFT